jgi:choline dehydrogenase
VLLIEAGPDLRSNLPEGFSDGWRLPQGFDWGYESEPGEQASVQPLRRGKLIGGTSWLTRFAVRGAPADYDAWAAMGNPGWAFDDVLPYFKQLETDIDFGDRCWHGDHGPLPITRYPDLELTDAGAAGMDALEATGFPVVDDHNRPGALGAGRMPMSSHGGVRVTTADAYLPVGSTPQSLSIRSESNVVEVAFDGTRARGVVLPDGDVIEAGWVVLSAGTYGSPSILMRSGVGPAEHLRSVEIPVRLDLPGVGANLADHAGVDIDCGYRDGARAAPVLHLIATFHSSFASSDEAPDLMFWLSDPRGDPPIFEIDVVLLRPRSRGRVRLRSHDPADPPLIELPGLRDPTDVDRLAEAYIRGLDVASRPELRRLCADPPSPGLREDHDVRDLIRANSYSIPHVVGTCSMGSRPEDGAVVDASGLVHGAERLSVVDASIIPNGPAAFTHVPTIMLAGRLSEQIATLLQRAHRSA